MQVFSGERMAGLPPTRTAVLLSGADLFVGNDSGPAHVAGFMGTKGIAVCGPSPGNILFSFYSCIKVVQARIPCSPCVFMADRGFRPECRLDCAAIHDVSVDEVFSAAESAMGD
jgi:ADP-heptose:LPS heptosyltransferase